MISTIAVSFQLIALSIIFKITIIENHYTLSRGVIFFPDELITHFFPTRHDYFFRKHVNWPSFAATTLKIRPDDFQESVRIVEDLINARLDGGRVNETAMDRLCIGRKRVARDGRR